MFDLIKGTIQSSKVIEDENGLYPIISIAEKNKLTNNIHEKYLINGKNIFIATTSSGTSCGPFETKIKYYDGICSYTNLLSKIQLNKDYKHKINIKYIYYILKNNKKYIEETYEKGLANKSLNIEKFKLMKIPIPSIEVQNKIIEYLDIIYEEVIKTNNEKIEKIKKLNKNYLDLNLQFNKDIEIKTLSEVCEFQNGTQLDKKDIINGDIPIFGGGFKIVGYHNNYNRNGNETIICGTGNAGYVNHNYEKPFWASQCFTMKSKNNNIIIDKYLYYYSKIILEKEFISNQKGTAIPYIRFTQIIDLKIPIPSIEKQKEIIEYLEFNDNLIKTLEKENEINKNNAELLMKQILYK